MMKRNRVRWLGASAFCLVLCACKESTEEKQDVSHDLTKYAAQAKEWGSREDEVLKAAERVKDAQFVDDVFTVSTLKEALPKLQSLIKAVDTYEPDTMDVEDIHGTYLAGLKGLEIAFQNVINVVEAKDYVSLAKEKNRFDTARGQIFTSYVLLDEMLMAQTGRSPEGAPPGGAMPPGQPGTGESPEGAGESGSAVPAPEAPAAGEPPPTRAS